MANFDFDLENAENELDDVEKLISVFLGFFDEERPFGEKPDTTEALVFVHNCETYESVIHAGFDKIRRLHADMETAIEKYFSESKKEGGEVA